MTRWLSSRCWRSRLAVRPELRSRRRISTLGWRAIALCFPLAFGGLATYGMFRTYQTHLAWHEAQSTAPATCRILSSEVVAEERTDSEGDTSICYRPRVRYAYPHSGGEGEGEAITPYDVHLSHICEERWAVLRIAPYAAGTDVACWVDPQRASRAYLDRSLRLTSVAWAALLLPLLLASLFYVGLALRPGFGGAIRRARPTPRVGDQRVIIDTRPRAWPLALGTSCIVYLAATLSLFVIAPEDTGGSPGLVLSGAALLALACGAIYLLMRRRGPRVTLLAKDPRFLRGHTHVLELVVESPCAPASVRVGLAGYEGGNMKDGTSHSKRFHEQTLLSLGRGPRHIRRELELALPADTMHSFVSEVGHVRWSLSVAIEVPRWPDLQLAEVVEVE